MIPIIFIIKIAEFDHVLFKQRGDSRGEAATSCASSKIVQSLTNYIIVILNPKPLLLNPYHNRLVSLIQFY